MTQARLTHLDTYLALEEVIENVLDEEQDEDVIDRIRDLMDFVWYEKLSETQRGYLNGR